MRLDAEKGWEGQKMGDGVTACGWRVLYRTQVPRPWYLLWCDCGGFRFLKLFCPETGQEVRQVERRHREAAQVRARPSGHGRISPGRLCVLGGPGSFRPTYSAAGGDFIRPDSCDCNGLAAGAAMACGFLSAVD